MEPEEVVAEFRGLRACAILRTDDKSKARRLMEAAVRGGFRIVEFTLTIPGAFDLISEFSKKDGLVVGAGTVLTVEQARGAVKAGARFLVSPVTDEAVIRAAVDLGVAVMPGAHTPTEMLRAHRAGAQLVKLFPSPGAGPAYIRQIRGPLPFLKVVPTSGVDVSNAAAFLEAGAWAVGLVGSLFEAKDVEARARELLAAVSAARISKARSHVPIR